MTETRRTMRFLTFWFPVLVYSGIIFCVSSIPNYRAPYSEFQFDKILHIIFYIPFGYLVARLLQAASSRNLVLYTAMITLLYGMSDEFHQAFVPGRTLEVIDLIGDIVGGIIGGLFQIRFNKSAGHHK